MAREEIKVEFTGLALDHLMASNRIQSAQANSLHHHSHTTTASPHQRPRRHQRNHSSSHPATTNSNHYNLSHELDHLQHHIPLPPSPTTNQNAAHSFHPPVDGPPTPPPSVEGKQEEVAALSTIAILRRHPMYDSLVLVKKWRPCLSGYTLEFPTSTQEPQGAEADGQSEDATPDRANDMACCRTKLVAVYLDGDDPIYQNQQLKLKEQQQQQQPEGHEQQDEGEVVYVPINGLLYRLDKLDKQGISIDSRVYAFAMGLKTVERFLSSSAEKEIQEAPPL